MTKRLHTISMLGVAVLTSLSLASCGHTHAFVEHTATNPTCTENGNSLYYSCSGCDKYFGADKATEVSKDSWVIAPLGHNFKLSYEGTYKKDYHDGETFDTTGLTFKKCCQREGCKTCETVSKYTVTYQSQGKTTISASDTKVIVSADSLSVDVPISVGHQYKLTYSGTFTTEYDVGETFDTTGLIVKKVCKVPGCQESITLTNYDVVYETSGKSVFSPGDTKVTISADSLSVDIPVKVNLLQNEITGLADSYDIHCKQGVDLKDVSATSGEVSIKYYSDEATTQEVSLDNLVGNNTYYGVVTSDGVDPEYEIAKATTQVNVTHEKGDDIVSTEVIGYKYHTCKHCEYQEAVPMEASDISIRNNISAYGCNAPNMTKDDTEGINEAGYMSWGGGQSLTTINLSLPKINFTAFTYVDIFFKTNSASWAGGYVGLGLTSTETDLVNYVDHGITCTINLNVRFTGKKLVITTTVSDGTKTSTELKDENVFDGTSGLQLYFKYQMYRCIYLYTITPTVVTAADVNKLATLIGDGTNPYESNYILEAKQKLDLLSAEEAKKLDQGVEDKINESYSTFNASFEQLTNYYPGSFANGDYTSTQTINSISQDKDYGQVANFTINQGKNDNGKACASFSITGQNLTGKTIRFAIKNVDQIMNSPRLCFKYWDMKAINLTGWTEFTFDLSKATQPGEFTNGLWLKLQLDEAGTAADDLLNNTKWAISNVYIVKEV